MFDAFSLFFFLFIVLVRVAEIIPVRICESFYVRLLNASSMYMGIE